MDKIRIEVSNGFDDYIEVDLIEDGIRIETGYSGGVCEVDIPLPEALQLHRELGKMLGVESELLKCSKRANDMIAQLGFKGITHRHLTAAIKQAEGK